MQKLEIDAALDLLHAVPFRRTPFTCQEDHTYYVEVKARMKNITLALDEETIRAGREYARRHNLTLNGLVRKLLRQTVSRGAGDWIEEAFALMDQAPVPPGDVSWKRRDLYRA